MNHNRHGSFTKHPTTTEEIKRTPAPPPLDTIATRQLRDRKARENGISIMIDEPPMSNHYIEIRDADTGLVIRRMQPPRRGYVQINFDEQGKYKNANVGFTEG